MYRTSIHAFIISKVENIYIYVNVFKSELLDEEIEPREVVDGCLDIFGGLQLQLTPQAGGVAARDISSPINNERNTTNETHHSGNPL